MDVAKLLEFPIDFPSQRFVYNLSTKLVILNGIVSFLIGFTTQNIDYFVYFFGFFTVIILALTLPAFPQYKREKLDWFSIEISS